MKKIISILLCGFMVLSLASCMSKEEKQQANANAETAKPIIEEYLDENFDGADIKEIKCLVHTDTTGVFATRGATDYVRAKVKYGKETFYVLVNIETGKFYTDYYVDKIQREISNLVCDTTLVEKPRDMEFRVMLKEFDDVIDECWGFLEEDTDSAQKLLESEDYQVYALFKHIGSDENFKSLPLKSVFKDEYNSEFHIAFANYRSSARYVDEQLKGYDRISSLDSVFDDVSAYYNVSDLKSASNKSDSYREEYRYYKSKIYDDTEFVWDSECFNIAFSETTVEDTVVTDRYGDTKFYEINKKPIKLTCKYKNTYTIATDRRVFMYLPKELKNYYAVFDGKYDTDAERIKVYDNKYAYQSKALEPYDDEFTIGFYTTADNE